MLIRKYIASFPSSELRLLMVHLWCLARTHVWHALKFEHRNFMYVNMNNYSKYDHLVSGLGSNKSYYVALYTEQTFRLIDVSLHTYVYFIHVYIKLSLEWRGGLFSQCALKNLFIGPNISILFSPPKSSEGDNRSILALKQIIFVLPLDFPSKSKLQEVQVALLSSPT